MRIRTEKPHTKTKLKERERIRRRIKRILSVLECEDAEISVLLTSPDRMRELNIKWRKEDRAARILSFPQGDSPGPKKVLGDLVLRAGSKVFPDYLLVHGVLHLLGYRHRTSKETRIMEKRHKEVVSALRK